MNDIEFTNIVKYSISIRDVIRRMGYNITNTTQKDKAKRRIVDLNIDTSHFKRPTVVRSGRWGNDDNIKQFVSQAKNITDLLKLMGLKNVGANYQTANRHITRLNINTDHFVSTGSTSPFRDGGFLLEDILVGKHPQYPTFRLKKRILEAGVKDNRCENCGQGDEWNGAPLVLQLDHKNGINSDHRLENLQILCPNCHTQTTTYAGRNKNNSGIFGAGIRS